MRQIGAETAARRDATESAGTAERHDHDDRERTRRGTETARRRRGGGKDDQDDTGTAKGRSTFDEGRIEGDSILSSDLPLGSARCVLSQSSSFSRVFLLV